MAAIRWQHQNIKTRRRPPIRPPPTPPVLLRAVRNNNPRYNPLRARCPCHRDSIITMVSPFLLFLSAFLRREELLSCLGLTGMGVSNCAGRNSKSLWNNFQIFEVLKLSRGSNENPSSEDRRRFSKQYEMRSHIINFPL